MSRVPCTASASERTWSQEAWIGGRGPCPDCGRVVTIFNTRLLFPRGTASRHLAPEGVAPAPYAASS